MTYAAICHGAHGMTWYAYCGSVNPEKNKFNYGVTSSPERWRTICELATQLRELSPVLLERTGPQPVAPVVLSGPKADPLGYPSISYLFKRHQGAGYLFAVNSVAEPVTARFALKAGVAVESLYEDRRQVIGPDGLTDTFEPFGAHVYKIAK